MAILSILNSFFILIMMYMSYCNQCLHSLATKYDYQKTKKINNVILNEHPDFFPADNSSNIFVDFDNFLVGKLQNPSERDRKRLQYYTEITGLVDTISSSNFDFYQSSLQKDETLNYEHVVPQSALQKRNPQNEKPIYLNLLRYDPHIILKIWKQLNSLRMTSPIGEIDETKCVFPQCKDKECGIANGCKLLEVSNGKISVVKGNPDFEKTVNERILHGGVRIDLTTFQDKMKHCSNCILEPTNESKGMIARIILYFLCCYRNIIETPLAQEQKEIIKEYEQRLPEYIKWHQTYPPSDYEHFRNLAYCYMTNVINPFVGYFDATDNYITDTQLINKLIQHVFYYQGEHIDIKFAPNDLYMIGNIGQRYNKNFSAFIPTRDIIDKKRNPYLEKQKMQRAFETSMTFIPKFMRGGDTYYEKYLKYKEKYLQLKNNMI